MIEYSEKRDFHRMSIDRVAELRVNGSNQVDEAMVKDLSSGGLLLWVKQQLQPGSELTLTLEPGTDITPPLHAKVEVIRCEPLDDQPDTYAAACSMLEILE